MMIGIRDNAHGLFKQINIYPLCVANIKMQNEYNDIAF